MEESRETKEIRRTLPGTCEPVQENRAGTCRSCATSDPHIPETHHRTRQEKTPCSPGENRGRGRENGERKRRRRQEMRRDVQSLRRANVVRGNPSRRPERETFQEFRDSAVVWRGRGTFERLEKNETTDSTPGNPNTKIKPEPETHIDPSFLSHRYLQRRLAAREGNYEH